MKYVIWGAGTLGKRIYFHLKEEDIEAFIDNDKKKQGIKYCNKQVISFAEYKEKYADCYIIVAVLAEMEVVNELTKNGINKFFLLSECPGEFQEPFSRHLLKNYILKYIRKNRKYIIYGCSLYSIQVCQWLEENLGKRVSIIPQLDIEENFINNLQNDFPGNRIVKLDNKLLDKVDEILVTVEEADYEYLNKYISKERVLKNIYDCSEWIEEYYNPQMEYYKNLHTNKRCFIIGTGPSLRMEDLDALYKNGEICFSVNDIFYAYDKTGWRPNYYVVTDYMKILEGQALKNTTESIRFISDCCIPFLGENDHDLIIFHTQYEIPQSRKPKFSENFAQKSYLGGTVVYACMQLAVFMGFTEIYLLGVDCNYVKNSAGGNYFYDKGTEDIQDHGVRYMISAYKSAKDYADSHGIRILNATRGGKLEIFERADFDLLFKGKYQLE